MPKKLFFAAMFAVLLCSLVRSRPCAAQNSASPSAETTAQIPATPEQAGPLAEDNAEPSTMFPHSQIARWWISGQFNSILQAHPDFDAAYSGPNSLHAQGESKTSVLETLYTGYLTGHGTELLFDMESAGGRGIGDALGLAGFTNLDVVRNPDLGMTPYVARVEFHQTVRLSKEDVEADRGPLSLATSVPARRLEFRFGKMSVVDLFDVNSVGSDSHLQFMNWTIDNNGAYDYAADTRGYTYGFETEYQAKNWGLRFGEFLMPKVANGIHLDADLARARAENYELELRPAVLKGRKTVVRLLAYENHADMGDYEAAVTRYQEGRDPRPIIENTRRQGTVKYGFGFNAEQELARDIRVFVRLGWDEGQHESFCYTEVNSSVSAGADWAGTQWHRKLDKVGVAVVSDGISAAHQAYLRDGGLGFLLGDNPNYPAGAPAGGALNYGRENIIESYYTLHAWRGLYFAGDIQHIWNPGYNRDRGPVLVPSVRVHLEF